MPDLDHYEELMRKWSSEKELTPHPENENLIAYAMNELSQSDTEAILEHVSMCSQCSHILIKLGDINSFDSIPTFDKASDTKYNMRGALGEDIQKKMNRLFGKLCNWDHKPLHLLIPTFSLFLGIILGSLVGNKQSRQYVNVPIVDLYALQDIQRGFGEPVEIPSASLCILILNIPTNRLEKEYRVDVIDQSGSPIFSEVLHSNQAGNLTMGLTKDVINKSWRALVFDLSGHDPLATFELKSAQGDPL